MFISDYRVILILLAEGIAAWLLLIRLLPDRRLILRLSILAGILICCLARLSEIGYETLDYQNFLKHWVEYFRSNGGFRALRDPVGNYNIPYLYCLALFSYSSIYDLYLIKLLSFFFDFVLALSSVMLLSRFTESVPRQIMIFFFVLMLPTVFLNSSVWGQCDSVYTAFLILGLYLALADHPWLSVVSFTMSLAFKLQAVFVLPVVFVLMCSRKLRLRHGLIAPVTYVATVLPAVLAGRPFWDTITLYFNQTGSIGDGLNYNSPSVFSILEPLITDKASVSRIFIIIAALFTLLVILYCFLHRKQLSDEAVLVAAVLLAVGIPFLLPHMHDRYFFPADILTLILSFTFPLAYPVAMLTQFASLLGYHAYLKMRYLLLMYYGGYCLVLVLVVCSVLLVRLLHRRPGHLCPSPEITA